MKGFNRAVLAGVIMTVFAQANATDLTTDEQKFSYSLGSDIGLSLQQVDPDKDLDIDIVVEAIKDLYNGDEPKLSPEEMEKVMKSYAEKRMSKLKAEFDKIADDNAKKGQTFLDENKNKEGVHSTDSGLQYIMTKEGDGKQPTKDDTVTVNYEGRLLDGSVFDSSYERNEPASFKLNQVIPGWTEGLQLMKEGGKATFFIPSELAYGEQGAGPTIGPNETLTFEVELIKVEEE